MKEYILTSPLMPGCIKFKYNEKDHLIEFKIESTLTELQEGFIYHPANFPLLSSQLEKFAGKKGKIDEVSNITFERFWEEYDHKKGKIKAEVEWYKLTKDEMVKALIKIKNYKYYCHCHNHDMIYPERYLKYKRFNDE